MTGFFLFIWLGVASYMMVEVIKSYNNIRRLTKYGIKTSGIIIDIIEETDEKTFYYPIIEFETHTGKKIQAKSTTNWENPKINQQIELFYDKDNPEQMVEDTVYATSFGPKAFILILIVFLIVGVLGLLNYYSVIDLFGISDSLR